VTPPHTVTEEKCNQKKNDRNDCRRLAKNNENGGYRTCHVPDRQLRKDRQVSRFCGQLQRDINRVCNRIRKTIDFHGIDRFFASGSWNRHQYKVAEERVKSFLISESLKFTFNALFSELRQLRSLQKDVVLQMRKLARSERYRRTMDLLTSVPGIGVQTAIRLALEWGDMSRFETKEAFSAFLV